MSTAVWAVLGVIGLIVLVVLAIALWAIGAYNNFVRLKNLVSEGWSGIEVQLKRRSNLVPNLVATGKGYAELETSVFETVTQARASIGRGSVGEQAAAEGNMAKSLMNLFAVAENYPDLKADANFLSLQETLTSTENKIAFARQGYNDQVLFYNNKIQMFPSNIIAGMFNFGKRDFFEIENEAEREVPKVSF